MISLLSLVVVALLLVSLGCDWLSARYWPFELLSALRLHYLAVFALAALYGALRRRWGLALLAVAGLAINAWALKSVLWPPPPPPAASADAPAFTLMQANVHDENVDYQRFFERVESESPDVLALQEVTPHWIRALISNPALMRRYPWRKIGHGGDTALLSRLPLSAVHREFLPPYDSYVSARVSLGSRSATLLVIHPEHPTGGMQAWRQRRWVSALVSRRERLGQPLLIVGDFNATPWSPQFLRLKAGLGLRDGVEEGFGVQPTWPAGWGPLRIPIDHALVSDGLRLTRRVVGPSIGSDHLPCVSRVAFTP